MVCGLGRSIRTLPPGSVRVLGRIAGAVLMLYTRGGIRLQLRDEELWRHLSRAVRSGLPLGPGGGSSSLSDGSVPGSAPTIGRTDLEGASLYDEFSQHVVDEEGRTVSMNTAAEGEAQWLSVLLHSMASLHIGDLPLLELISRRILALPVSSFSPQVPPPTTPCTARFRLHVVLSDLPLHSTLPAPPETLPPPMQHSFPLLHLGRPILHLPSPASAHKKMKAYWPICRSAFVVLKTRPLYLPTN